MAPGGETAEIFTKIGELTVAVQNLEKKVEHNCEVSDQGDEKIVREIRAMKAKVCEKIDATNQKIEEHADYHDKNEHLWGFWKLLKKKPVIALIVGGILFSLMGISGAQIWVMIRKWIFKV